MPRSREGDGDTAGSEMQELNLNSTTNLDKSAVGSMVGAGGKELGEPIVILDGVQKVKLA